MHGLDGAEMGLAWVLPFGGLLVSIACVPVVAPHFWHRHYGKLAAGWAAVFVVPFSLRFGAGVALDEILRLEILEFLPFVLLIGSLYVVTGGVRIAGRLPATPLSNAALLAFGTAIASIVGTTGAAMLLIRPFLAANLHRKRRAHLVLFFILLVANAGGALTPLGDPPLFFGFLEGVDFFWTTRQLAAPTAVLAGLLLAAFVGVDVRCRRLDTAEGVAPPPRSPEPLRLVGGLNLILLAGILATVLAQAEWRPGIEVGILGVPVPLQTLSANLVFALLAGASLVVTRLEHRRPYGFTWEPMIEMIKLFSAIFVTIIPALAILHAGHDGAAAPLLAVLDRPARYFWVTGLLSSVLDNAPTYLIFFHAAGGDAQRLMTADAAILGAISAGAVYMGALTYIGNAPNLLVRAVARERGVPALGFFAHTGWAALVLGPAFALLTVLFF